MGFWDAYNESQEATMGMLKRYRVGGALGKGDTETAALEAYRLGDYELGSGIQRERERSDAINTRKAVGARVGEAMAVTDPTQRATALRGAASDAYASGDMDAGNDINRQISQLDDQQRQTAARSAQLLGKTAYSLQGMPYEARKQAIAAMAPQLLQQGFTQEQLAAFDPTDANLSGMVSQAMELSDLLQNARTAQEAQWRQEDRKADNERQAADAAERKRVNDERLDIARGNQGISRRREGRLSRPTGGAGGASQSVGRSLGSGAEPNWGR